MAYEAHKWKIGEEITSEKLNHIEKGIEEAGLPREITDPQDGQTLKYDAASGKWVNAEGGGSGKLIVNATTDSDTHITTLDKTWQEIFDASPNVVLQQRIPIGDGTLWKMLSAMSTVAGENKGYQVTFGDVNYYAATANDYPDSDEGSQG